MNELKRLQALRTKANQKRKPSYQKKIDNHFFDNSDFKKSNIDEPDWVTYLKS